MSAPDLETIWRVEEAVESAWKTVLAADGIAAFTTREDSILVIPRVDVTVQLGAVTGHRGQFAPGQFVLDAWSASIRCDVITKRVEDQAALHAEICGKVRLAAQYFQDRFGVATLPYHALSMIQESGTETSIGDEDETDRSSIQFDSIVSVRTNAWPS